MLSDPMLTDHGLCRTINSNTLSDIFKGTEYVGALMENLVEITNNSLRDFQITGFGSKFSFRLVLDFQEQINRLSSKYSYFSVANCE